MRSPPVGRRTAGMLLVALSAACFGAMPIFARFAYADGVSPVTLLALRFTVASAAMLLLLRVRRRPPPRGARLVGLVLMGAVGYVGQSLCYFTALLHASAGMVALLLYLYPALVALLAAACLGERLAPPRLAALALALVGTVLIVRAGGSAEPAGILLGIGAAVIYSVYIIAGTRLVPAGGAIEASTVVIASAAVVYLAAAGASGLRLPATAGGYVAVAAIAIVSTVVAIVAFFAGLDRIGPTAASTLSTLEPVVTVSLAATVLAEKLAAAQVAGGALVLAAVLLLARTTGGAGAEARAPAAARAEPAAAAARRRRGASRPT
jgi:drug/metabolite transporter (DMT)-like permease